MWRPRDGSEAPIEDWLALILAPRVGPRTFVRLMEGFGSPSAVRAASDTRLEQIGLKPETVAALRQPEAELIDTICAWAEQPDAHLITLADPRYPPALTEIADPPPLLYARGDARLLSEPQIAIVGSRNPTPGGREITSDFARRLAGHGLIVTSGLAIGIDGAAHAAALETGHSIAVLGTGPDRVYPAVHRDLARRLVERGVMVSELPPGQGPLASSFPRRNRLISGLSLGVLVTEAALKSGSLITARQALEQGREVFAIPGSIRNPLSRGCHALIREGAKLVEEPDEILAELAPQLRAALLASERAPAIGTPDSVLTLPPDQAQLLTEMGHDPVTLDDLTSRTGLAVERISSMLLLMELEGHVSSLPGGRYARVHNRS
ncbi:DNA-processing protein DprA [Allochromatium palmeri]|uniref:DNA-protecting protein DprA n=1 Tax=Allochromatium palmeri TaxID=231048 RepID=A0A6N8ECB3_9GAMM|nr:DNA-processing protein DprA [Allochromatium palmeri]MTW19994.1 DNA-protecting protein DprA [Allochromatium palmeri]